MNVKNIILINTLYLIFIRIINKANITLQKVTQLWLLNLSYIRCLVLSKLCTSTLADEFVLNTVLSFRIIFSLQLYVLISPHTSRDREWLQLNHPHFSL